MIGYLNELWRYRMNDSTWTWISNEEGEHDEEGIPGARCCAVGWYDSLRQEFWLFGGENSGLRM